MNANTKKKKAALLLELRKTKSKIAAIKKAACLQQQKEAFQEWRQALKQAEDCETARDNGASAAMRGICTKEAISRTDLEHEYANFSWETERLKKLQETAQEKAEMHAKRLQVTHEARLAHIYYENKSDQALRFFEKAKRFHLNHLLSIEAEENEEVATSQYILKSVKS